MALAFFAVLLFATELWMESREGHLTQTYVVAMIMFSVMIPAILAILAGIITVIGAMWREQDRGNLFMKLHFYLMVVLIPAGLLPSVFRLILAH
jgi:magnesium-transporting ATPase (P-type)